MSDILCLSSFVPCPAQPNPSPGGHSLSRRDDAASRVCSARLAGPDSGVVRLSLFLPKRRQQFVRLGSSFLSAPSILLVPRYLARTRAQQTWKVTAPHCVD